MPYLKILVKSELILLQGERKKRSFCHWFKLLGLSQFNSTKLVLRSELKHAPFIAFSWTHISTSNSSVKFCLMRFWFNLRLLEQQFDKIWVHFDIKKVWLQIFSWKFSGLKMKFLSIFELTNYSISSVMDGRVLARTNESSCQHAKPRSLTKNGLLPYTTQVERAIKTFKYLENIFVAAWLVV